MDHSHFPGERETKWWDGTVIREQNLPSLVFKKNLLPHYVLEIQMIQIQRWWTEEFNLFIQSLPPFWFYCVLKLCWGLDSQGLKLFRILIFPLDMYRTEVAEQIVKTNCKKTETNKWTKLSSTDTCLVKKISMKKHNFFNVSPPNLLLKVYILKLYS